MPLSSVLGASSVIRPGVCTSTTRPSVPYTGQLIYETDTGRVASWNGSAWLYTATGAVLQVKAATKTDLFSTSSTTFVDITGLSVSITPISSSNKILVMAAVTYGNNASTSTAFLNLVRGSTSIAVGDAASTRSQATQAFYTVSGSSQQAGSTIWLDSPATTSATTYKMQIRTNTAATVRVNATADDTDDPTRARTVSSITVMEVAP